MVARSTIEAEYIALSTASNQAIWLQKLLGDLSFIQKNPTKMFCDNKSAISIAENPVQHKRTKHIKVKFHAIRVAVNEFEIKVLDCPTEEQLVDLMTKALPKARLESLKTNLGMTQEHLKEEC